MFYIVSTSLSFLLALILFTKRGKTKADLLLACWLVVIGIHLAFYYTGLVADPYYHPYLLVSYPFPLLHGPFLYFYTASLTNQHPYLKKHFIWHFTPTLFIYLILLPFFLRPHAERLEVFANEGRGYELVFIIQRILVLASGVSYTLLSLWLLRKHIVNMQNRFSQTEKINLLWLRYLIYGVGVVWFAVFFGNDFVIFSLVALFVFLLGYFGIKQVGIFTQIHIGDAEILPHPVMTSTPGDSLVPEEAIKTKYLKSTLSPEKQSDIHRKLTWAMEEQKLFLNPELTIGQLAEALAVHSSHLSQVINSMESKSFYDFINALRINEFKKMAARPGNQKYTLLALAFECGFNSKTAFYRNFKHVTGQSPTHYLKENHLQIQAD
ncbi:MAG: helix-turn-helix domain-containing protein [Cytophagia bacterium]|nr:helix-turn-helix domain-containing protein [Cytophagia bacterium]